MTKKKVYCHWCLKNQPAGQAYSEAKHTVVPVCAVCNNTVVSEPKKKAKSQ